MRPQVFGLGAGLAKLTAQSPPRERASKCLPLTVTVTLTAKHLGAIHLDIRGPT